MTSVASETVTFSSRAPQFQRSHSSAKAQDGEPPFSMMLETSAPPAEPAPRRTEPAEPPAPSQKAAPVDPNRKPAAETSGGKTANTSEPAADDDAADGEVAEAADGSEHAAVENALPDMPQTEDIAEASTKSPDAAAVVAVAAQPETVRPQIAAAPQVAAPVPATPEAIPPAQAGGEAVPEIAVKPVTNAVPQAQPLPEAPIAAPVASAPELPVPADPQGLKNTPEIKGKVEIALDDVSAETAEQPLKPELQPNQPLQVKTEQARAQAQPEEVKPQQAETKPRPESESSIKPAQQTAAPEAAAATDATNNRLPPATPTVVPEGAAGAGHARASLITTGAVPVSGIAVEIAAQARAGNNRFEIRLDPPELGRIDVRLDVDQDGNVKSRLVIERADTYDLLRRDSSTLERALQQAGLKTSDNGLEFTLRDQGSAQREARDQNPRNADRAIIPDADVLPAEAVSGYSRVLGLGTGIDIRI